MTREEALDIINSRDLSQPVADALLSYVQDPVNLAANAASLITDIPGIGTAINFADTLLSPNSYTYSALPGGVDNPYGPRGQFGLGTLGHTGLSITPDMLDLDGNFKAGPQGYGYNFDLSGRTFAQEKDYASEAERKGVYSDIPVEDLGIGFQKEVAEEMAVTEALERGEPTYIDPSTGMTKNVSDYIAPSTPGGLLAQTNPTSSPLQIGLGLLGWDPENSPPGASYSYGNKGYNPGAVQVQDLAPPAGLFDARLDDQIGQWAAELLNNELDQIDREGAFDGGGGSAGGGNLGGADDFSDSDSSGDFFCLSPDTKVKTKDGLKEVKNLKVGDTIKSIYGYGTVTEVINNHIRSGYYCINDDLHITNDHPILTKKGWYRTEDLKIGDDLGGTIVKSIDYIEGPVETVSITTDTEDFNVYGKDVVYSVNGRYKLSLFKNAA
jgi:hypothetical protein